VHDGRLDHSLPRKSWLPFPFPFFPFPYFPFPFFPFPFFPFPYFPFPFFFFPYFPFLSDWVLQLSLSLSVEEEGQA
jgi:hypothetical protein